MVYYFPIGARPIFRGKPLVSGRVSRKNWTDDEGNSSDQQWYFVLHRLCAGLVGHVWSLLVAFTNPRIIQQVLHWVMRRQISREVAGNYSESNENNLSELLSSMYWQILYFRVFIYIYIYRIPSMYGIFTYIRLISMINVGKYTIRGWYVHVYSVGAKSKCISSYQSPIPFSILKHLFQLFFTLESFSHHTYCWWFRNPAPPGMHKTL